MALSTIPFSGLGADASNQGINFRNLIINGDMSIAQRGTSFTSDQYVLDRFTTSNNNHSGAWSWTQVTDAPSGFKYSAKFTTTTADSSTATNQYSLLRHYIEGSNISHLKFGTSDAETITVSFYVKSSLTGTFGGSISNDDQNRSYPFTYTISSASTWERKTITLSGDTTGTWKTDTSTGIRINFSMGTGTSYQGTSGAWNGDTDFSATGETSVLATLNATWQITGVQLEVGTSASDFEFLPFDVNLQRCQRYFYSTMYLSDANSFTAPTNNYPEVQGTRHRYADVTGYRSQQVNHPVVMRATPSTTFYNPDNSGASGQFRLFDHNGNTQNFSGGVTHTIKKLSMAFNGYTGVSVGSTGLSCLTFAHWENSAEL